MKHRIFSFATVVSAILAMATGFSSCKEDIAIHSNLTPAGDNIGTDTLVIPDSLLVAQTIIDDTLLTSTKLVTSYTVFHALGWLKEPVDPTRNPYPSNTNARIFLQFVPVSTGFTFPSTDVIDSAVIVLPYGGFSWGDTTVRDEQEIQAFELTDTMSNNTNYYSYTQKAQGGSVSAPVKFYTGKAGTGVINDSVSVRGVKTPPHLRIRLTDAYLNTFKGVVARGYTTHDSFLNAVKGFCIRPVDESKTGRAMPYFTIYGPSTSGYYNQSNLLVYAHANGDTTLKTYQFPFSTTYTAHYNYIKRTYGNMSLFNDPNHPYLMVENQPGAAIDFRIKNLRSLNALKGNIVINKVQLIFNEVNEFVYPDSKYGHPPRIYPIGIDAVGVRYTLVDRYEDYSTKYALQTGLDFVDGKPVTNTTNNNTTYAINFPRELQRSMIQQKSELHLRINGTLTYPGAFRLIAGNRSNPNAQYRYALKIIYSKQK